MVMKRSGALKTVITAALLCVAALANAAPGVRAQVDRNAVQVGESITLSIVVEGVASTGAPTVPPIPGVRQNSVSQRSEYVIENGQASSKQIYDYQLIALQPGPVNIPAVAVQAGGSIFSTQPITINVLPRGAAQPGATQPA